MKCPCCGAAELVADTRDCPYTYKGETITIPMVTAEFCSACGEFIADMAESQRIIHAIHAFKNKMSSAS